MKKAEKNQRRWRGLEEGGEAAEEGGEASRKVVRPLERAEKGHSRKAVKPPKKVERKERAEKTEEEGKKLRKGENPVRRW